MLKISASIAQDQQAEALSNAKAYAIQRIAEWIDKTLQAAFTDGVPKISVNSWPSKEAHARAHLSGEPAAPILMSEAEGKGISTLTLATRIVANADFYGSVIGDADSMRSNISALINAANTAAAIDAILAHAMREAMTKLKRKQEAFQNGSV